jgi:hypothetical protein
MADRVHRLCEWHLNRLAHCETCYEPWPCRAELLRRIERVRELHTDSPAGFCPSCARLHVVSDVDDGFVAFPCPTLRALEGEEVPEPEGYAFAEQEAARIAAERVNADG